MGKSARITLFVSPVFKRKLETESRRLELSVSELIRGRFDETSSDEEALVVELVRQLRVAVEAAHREVEELVAARAGRERPLHDEWTAPA